MDIRENYNFKAFTVDSFPQKIYDALSTSFYKHPPKKIGSDTPYRKVKTFVALIFVLIFTRSHLYFKCFSLYFLYSFAQIGNHFSLRSFYKERKI